MCLEVRKHLKSSREIVEALSDVANLWSSQGIAAMLVSIPKSGGRPTKSQQHAVKVGRKNAKRWNTCMADACMPERDIEPARFQEISIDTTSPPATTVAHVEPTKCAVLLHVVVWRRFEERQYGCPLIAFVRSSPQPHPLAQGAPKYV